MIAGGGSFKAFENGGVHRPLGAYSHHLNIMLMASRGKRGRKWLMQLATSCIVHQQHQPEFNYIHIWKEFRCLHGYVWPESAKIVANCAEPIS